MWKHLVAVVVLFALSFACGLFGSWMIGNSYGDYLFRQAVGKRLFLAAAVGLMAFSAASCFPDKENRTRPVVRLLYIVTWVLVSAACGFLTYSPPVDWSL